MESIWQQKDYYLKVVTLIKVIEFDYQAFSDERKKRNGYCNWKEEEKKKKHGKRYSIIEFTNFIYDY